MQQIDTRTISYSQNYTVSLPAGRTNNNCLILVVTENRAHTSRREGRNSNGQVAWGPDVQTGSGWISGNTSVTNNASGSSVNISANMGGTSESYTYGNLDYTYSQSDTCTVTVYIAYAG